ncbi:activating transcription factor 7-interacting protein 1-like isoform X2 [Pseudophryne corroboree]|uniref:activating transcription factor 7-interacting protein 1-like isoform X2 n=1 Tax=Pseudophryne corroboree TaxID=495146 RepID=UPI0030820545
MMDTGEEPKKKIFKARKTMKASDRQQLEAVHKTKEDLLKPTELVNGNHENCDSDMNFDINDSDPMEEKKDLNGIDINSDSFDSVVKLPDIKEGLINDDRTSDLELPLDFELPESITCQEDTSKIMTSGTAVQVCSTDGEQQIDEKTTALDEVEQREQEALPLAENLLCDTEFSEQQPLCNILEDKSPDLEAVQNMEDENPVEPTIEKELEHEDMDTVSGSPIAKAENETEDHIFKEPIDTEPVVSNNTVEKAENLNEEHHENEADYKNLPDNEMHNAEDAEENHVPQDNIEVNGPHEPNILPDMAVPEAGYSSEENRETSETLSPQQDFGEEAISSSMEVDQIVRTEEEISSPGEAHIDTPVSDLQAVTRLESSDTMETDEIIPILEKLAPVEDELQYFVKPDLLSESVGDAEEEKTENNATSPSKNDVSETLPREAFLVLSDEEELSGESTTLKESISNEQAETFRRKRSKSEDLDSQSSKRRRFEGEEYEAELQVKITAGDDLNKKLQKVIQKLFEEKLSALQCIEFDKAIAELKTRVEKIECKKHETVLHSMQAKITRLTRRFGAAKKDLKKRPEQTTVTQPASPGKSAASDSAPSLDAMVYRAAGTVRQMLESKRNVGGTTTPNVQFSPAAPPSVSSSSNLTLRTSNTTQMPVSQSPVNTTLQTRAPPDWKLIQQKINASSIGTSSYTLSSQSKPITPVTMTSVLPTPSTATVVGNGQVPTSSTQTTLSSLPFILHVPVAMPSQPQLLQSTTGTLVTNKQSGNVEFIPVQNQSTVGSLSKTPMSLSVTKAINSPSMPSPGIQRNSPASSIASTLTVQAIPTTHSVTLSSRPSLPTVGTSGTYSQASNRNTAQLSVFNNSSSSESPSGGRSELQTNRTQTAEPAASKRTESSALGRKAGVIDLTLDDEDVVSSPQDSRRTNSAAVSGTVQSSQPVARPAQPSQANTLQTSTAPAGLPSQATIHVLPTAQTTVNITQRPGIQAAQRPSAPRAPNNPHMVYTSTTLPTVPVQTPVRNTVMQSQNLRQINPQTGGVPVRMPQATAYVVNNGMSISTTGPQLTVHHRPPQEPARSIHPAPLPEAPQPQRLPPEASSTSVPQKPHLKLARVQSQNGIVLSWSVLEVDRSCAVVDSYHLYAYHEDPTATSPSQWKKIGEVKALPLPMACTLTQFVSGSKYYFAVRAKDIYGRFGPFCDPQSTDVISTQSS